MEDPLREQRQHGAFLAEQLNCARFSFSPRLTLDRCIDLLVAVNALVGGMVPGHRCAAAGRAVIHLLRQVAAEQVAELDRLTEAYLGDRSGLESITQAALRARLRAGDVVLIDVRPPAEYIAGHIQGAQSVPLPDLARRLKDLPKDSDVVAYCRGPYCVYADDAVRLLRRRGFRARRLENGYPEWTRAGLPTASGAAPS